MIGAPPKLVLGQLGQLGLEGSQTATPPSQYLGWWWGWWRRSKGAPKPIPTAPVNTNSPRGNVGDGAPPPPPPQVIDLCLRLDDFGCSARPDNVA
jgi:hypothetical protein